MVRGAVWGRAGLLFIVETRYLICDMRQQYVAK